MFLVDDVLKDALSYFFKRVEAGRTQHDASIKSIRVAMRVLASSLSEITLLLEAGLHRLKRSASDRKTFFEELDRLVSSDFLQKACNESGICKELRIAQDELMNIARGNSSKDLTNVANLAHQLEAYESAFVSAIREFLLKARDVDVMTTPAAKRSVDTTTIVSAFEERVGKLNSVSDEIEGLLKKIREAAF